MNLNMIPFNLSLLLLSDTDAKTLGQVKALDIFLPSSRNFHPAGLFSTEIFGRIGDSRRNYTFGYIDLHAPILHPVIYETLGKLKGLYTHILLNKEYANWDPVLKDFVKATPTTGNTGYHFFMSHFKDIQYKETDSDKRAFFIKLMQKYKDSCMFNKLLVMPAGIRDYEIDAFGKPSEDEINVFYRKIISLSNLLEGSTKNFENEAFDSLRASMQTAVYDLYQYIIGLLEGKHKLVLGKWASRRIVNGTRNVITTVNNEVETLNSHLTVSFNDTVVGLFQFMKGTLPKMIYFLRNGFLTDVFTGPNTPAYLINPKTLHRETVHINPSEFDAWMTSEGLETKINHYAEEDTRHLPVKVNEHYIGLSCLSDDKKAVIWLRDIDELPAPETLGLPKFSKENVKPITYTELFYCSANAYYRDIYGFFTRYPITGYGSIYPCSVFLKTTIPSLDVLFYVGKALDAAPIKMPQYPVLGADFMNSMSPNSTHLKRLGADFDGDTCSMNFIYTEEGTAEIRKLLKSKSYYVDANGAVNFSASNDALDFTLSQMTA